jgi:hypothetical protein
VVNPLKAVQLFFVFEHITPIKISAKKNSDNLAKYTDLWYSNFWHIHGSNSTKREEIIEHNFCFAYILIQKQNMRRNNKYRYG